MIANTAWRNPVREKHDHGGGHWHIDAGPHVPRPGRTCRGTTAFPYPVFAIGGAHPAPATARSKPVDRPAVIPGSHRSGQHPPFDRLLRTSSLEYDEGSSVVPLTGRGGATSLLFVSDVWHRRMPTTPEDDGRFFLQVHYGRRDIAQRVHTTEQTHQVSAEATARATSDRDRSVLGLHEPFFYDG